MNLDKLNAIAQSMKDNSNAATRYAGYIQRTKELRGLDATLNEILTQSLRYDYQEQKDILQQAAMAFRDPILRHAELLMECKRREHTAKADADRAILALHCPDDAPAPGGTQP